MLWEKIRNSLSRFLLSVLEILKGGRPKEFLNEKFKQLQKLNFVGFYKEWGMNQSLSIQIQCVVSWRQLAKSDVWELLLKLKWKSKKQSMQKSLRMQSKTPNVKLEVEFRRLEWNFTQFSESKWKFDREQPIW